MESRDTALAADRNLCDSNIVFFAHSQAGEVQENIDAQFVSCGFPVAEFNTLVLKRVPDDLEATLQGAQEFFDARSLPYVVTVREDLTGGCIKALEGAGFERCGRAPEMTLDPIRRGVAHLAALETREVTNAEALRSFARVAFEGFGLPAAAAPAFMTEALLELPQLRLYLGFADGEPVCSSALVQTGRMAGIYWVATLEAYRGRGLGAAITSAAVDAGIEWGCDIASLQASEMGAPIYERMGFATPFHYLRFARLAEG